MSESVFQFQDAEESPGLLLWQTMVVWQRLIKTALINVGISHSHFVILATLLWCEENNILPNQACLVKYSKLDKMTISQALKKLATQKLIKRSEYAKDTRAKVVALTAKGRTMVKKLVPIIEAVDDNFFKPLSKQSKKHIIEMLTNLIQGIEHE